MNEENYIPHLNFSGLYNNLHELIPELPLPGNFIESSLNGLNNLIEEDGSYTDKINELLGENDTQQQDKHIRNRLLGQSIVSALRSTSLDEFNPLISKLYSHNQNTTRFTAIEDKCSPLFKEILFLDPGCFNDVPLSDNHLKLMKDKKEILNEFDCHIQNDLYVKAEGYTEGLGERVKKRKRRPTFSNHINSNLSEIQHSDDENTENHLDLLLSKKFKTSITKETMGIKTTNSFTKNKENSRKQRKNPKNMLKNRRNTHQGILATDEETETDHESLIYGDDDELESEVSGEEIKMNSHQGGENDDEDDGSTSDVSYDGTKDNLYQHHKGKSKKTNKKLSKLSNCNNVKKGKKGKREKIYKKEKKSYLESVRKPLGNKLRSNCKIMSSSSAGSEEDEMKETSEKSRDNVKSEYMVEYNDEGDDEEVNSVISSTFKKESSTDNCENVSEKSMSTHKNADLLKRTRTAGSGAPLPKNYARKNKKCAKFKDVLSKDEIMDSPLYVKFDNLLDKIIEHSEESDLPSLLIKKKDNLEEDIEVPIDSLIPKSLHSISTSEAAKIKALGYTHVFNTEKIIKMFTIFLWNIRDGMKVLPLMQHGGSCERDSENKLWEEMAWERVFRSADCSFIALTLLTSPLISKKLFMEDLIEIIIHFTKYHLVNTIYPEFDPVYKINKSKDFYVKARRYKSHQVESKHTLTLYSKLNAILNMLGELVEVQTLTDSSIILISSLGTQPFFVENVNDLQLNALRLITSIFSRYNKHRQLILEDILSSLARLPISKRNLRSYKIDGEVSIQMVSALVLQLIHCIVDFPPISYFKDLPNILVHSKENVPDHDVLTLNSYDNAAKTAHTFLAVFLKKCSVRTCSEEDFRTLFDHFIDDLLITVNKAEWPAAELLLTILGRILVQNFSDRKVEISLRLASLEYLGKITSRLRKDSLTNQSDAKTLKEIFEQIRVSNEESSADQKSSREESETLKLQRLLLNYLQENSVNDPFIRFARKFIIIQWYCDILLKANKNATENLTNNNNDSENNNDDFIRSTRKLSDAKSSYDSPLSRSDSENDIEEDDSYRPKLKGKTSKTRNNEILSPKETESSVQSRPGDKAGKGSSSKGRKHQQRRKEKKLDENSSDYFEYHKKFLISFVYPNLSSSSADNSCAPLNTTPSSKNKDPSCHHSLDNNTQESHDKNKETTPSLDIITPASNSNSTTLQENKINVDLIKSFDINYSQSTSLFNKHIKTIHLDCEQSSIIAKYLASKRVFSRNYEIYLIQIMKVVHESAIAIRTKAMKCLANIIEADPGILAQTSIQSTIHLRLMDQSPSVREAAVELIGKCILAKSELIPQYFNMIAERILDTGVSVRKRVIRILRDICNDFPEYQNITSICCKLVRRINDEEGIKKLVIEVFQAMWFNTEFTNEIIDKKLSNITETVNYFMEHGPDLIETLFENILANPEDPNCVNARKTGTKIVDLLIEKVMKLDENKDETNINRTHRLVACLSTLYLFTKIDPEFTVKHCDTLQPYLVQKCYLQGDCMIIHYVARIFRLTVPKMGHPNPIFLSHLEESLMKLIVTQGMLVLESCVACLADIIKNVTHNYGLITDCFLRFFGILYKMALETYENDKSTLLVTKKPFVLRSLYTVGLLSMHFDFDQDYMKLNKKLFQEKLLCWENQYYSSVNSKSSSQQSNQKSGEHLENRKKIPFLNTSNMIPVSECVYEIFYHFVTLKDEVIKLKALTGLGFFCINNSRYLSHTKTKELYQLFLTDSSIPVNLKYQVLKNIYAYLQEEENKATMANKEYDKTKKEDDFKEICEMSTSLSSAIVQIYLKDLLDRCLDAEPNVRLATSNVIATIIKQGLIYPVQCIPHLITMATDPNSLIKNKAYKILADLDVKYPGFISMKALAGARKSFEFHKILHLFELADEARHVSSTAAAGTSSSTSNNSVSGKKIRGRKSRTNLVEDADAAGELNENRNSASSLFEHVIRGFFNSQLLFSQATNTATVSGSPSATSFPPPSNIHQQPSATIGFLYSLLRNSKSQRRFFLDSLLKLFDEQSRVPLEELLYVADNLAYFPYVNQDEPLFLLHQMEIMTSVTGSNLLQAFSESLGRDSFPSLNASKTTTNISLLRNEEEDEDNLDKLLASVSDHPVSLYECCLASQGYFLLLYLRLFLKNLYSLTDNKLANYSPMDTSKVFDKPISANLRKPVGLFTPQSTLEYLESCSSELSSIISSPHNINKSTNEGFLNRKMPDPKEQVYSTPEKLNLIRQYLEFKEMMLKLDPNEEDDEDVKAIKASRELKAQHKLNSFKSSSQKCNKGENEISYTIQQINSLNEIAPNSIPKVHIRLNKLTLPYNNSHLMRSPLPQSSPHQLSQHQLPRSSNLNPPCFGVTNNSTNFVPQSINLSAMSNLYVAPPTNQSAATQYGRNIDGGCSNLLNLAATVNNIFDLSYQPPPQQPLKPIHNPIILGNGKNKTQLAGAYPKSCSTLSPLKSGHLPYPNQQQQQPPYYHPYNITNLISSNSTNTVPSQNSTNLFTEVCSAKPFYRPSSLFQQALNNEKAPITASHQHNAIIGASSSNPYINNLNNNNNFHHNSPSFPFSSGVEASNISSFKHKINFIDPKESAIPLVPLPKHPFKFPPPSTLQSPLHHSSSSFATNNPAAQQVTTTVTGTNNNTDFSYNLREFLQR